MLFRSIWYLAKMFKGAHFYILTVNRLLRAQLNAVMEPYLRELGNFHIHFNQFPRQHGGAPVFAFVDEADKFVKKNAAKFTSSGLEGLHLFRDCTQTFLYTASRTRFLEQAVEIITNDVTPAVVHEFKSKAQYSGINDCENDLYLEKCADLQEMKDKLKTDLLGMHKDKPMILFSNAENKKIFFDEVAGWLPQDLTKVYVESVDDALKRRDTEKYETSGFYCFNLKLSRGTDIKLMKDAHVFICAVTGDFPLDEAIQMLGRGTRSFGESEGTYYSLYASKAGNLKRYLKGLEIGRAHV